MNVKKELRNLLAKQQEEEYFHISLEEEFAFYRDIASGNPDILQGDIANQNWEHMGTLSANPLQNMKYHQVILIAMITRFCIEGGLEPEQICWDPGIGFGKTAEHNLALLSNMDKLQVAGRPVLLGLSRKRMLGAVLGDAEQGRAPLSTAVMTVWGHLHGAQIHRVHDVAECARALRLIRAAEPFVAD